MTLATARDHIAMIYGPPTSVVSDILRGCLTAAPGHDLIGCDESSIESRKLNWLADETRILDIYRGHGKIYEYNASGIYGVSIDNVTPIQRQIGKISELALGFCGGVGAFQMMAKNYGVKVSDSQAETIKQGWRASHPNVVRYWKEVEQAAMAAIRNPGEKIKAGRVTYLKKGSFLFCQLPSGRAITYPYPQIEQIEVKLKGKPSFSKDCVTSMAVNSVSRKFERQKTWVGVLVENIVQASSRDVLVEGMLRLEARGYPIVMHCHDELVAEVREHQGAVSEVEKLMSAPIPWAPGLPLAAKGWRGKRYQK